MVTLTVITYPEFIALSLILLIILAINFFLCKNQLFQGHNHFSYIFQTFQDQNSWYYIFHTFKDHRRV